MRSTLLLVSLAACGFRVSPGQGSDGGGPADASVDIPGYDAPVGDGPPLDAMGVCPWPYTTPHVTVCDLLPATTPSSLDLAMAGVYTYSSGGSLLTQPAGPPIPLLTSQVGGKRLVWTSSLRVRSGATLHVVGPDPVVFVSFAGVEIEGLIDAGSSSANSPRDGAGADPIACANVAAGNGAPCSHGGSGGGGGGFGTLGGNGGVGGFTRNCVAGMDGQGITGGIGGLVLVPTDLQGGCKGGDGAMGNGSAPGLGGAGGGAVAVLARDALVIRATGGVSAGGAGGLPSTGGRSGGGGGGSGGMISLAGTTLTVEGNGVLAANGGGGGGGSNGNAAMPGVDGRPIDQVAEGGAKESDGGDGGNGAFLLVPAEGGDMGERGGGGGGGGVGVIRLLAAPGNPPQTAGAKISPPAS